MWKLRNDALKNKECQPQLYMFSQQKIGIPVTAVKHFAQTRNSALLQRSVTRFKNRDNNLSLHLSKQGPRRPLFSGNVHLSSDRHVNTDTADSV